MPPLTRTRPLRSVRMRCSREALTVPPDHGPGPVSAARARVRRDDIGHGQVHVQRAVYVAENLGYFAGRRYGRSHGSRSSRSVVPMTQWAGPGTRKQTRPGILSVSPYRLGMRSRRTTRCAPRLGSMDCESPDANGPSGRDAQTPVASTTTSARISSLVGGQRIRGEAAVDAPVRLRAADRPRPSRRPSRPGRERFGGRRSRSARRPPGRRDRRSLRGANFVAGREPPPVPRLSRDDDGFAVGGGSEQVVHSQPGAVERSVPKPAVHREEERLQANQMRRDPQQSGSFTEGFSHESDLELLQVSKPSVDQPGRSAAGPTAKSSRRSEPRASPWRRRPTRRRIRLSRR